MSLINQMLKDLDQRQASHADSLGQISSVTLPVKQHRIAYVISTIILISAVILAGIAWQQRTQPVITQTTPAVTPLPAPAQPGLILTKKLSPSPINKTSPVALKPALPVNNTPTLATTPIPAPPIAAPTANTTLISKKIEPLTTAQLAENSYRKAVSLMQQGRTEDSISELNQALTLDPHHHEARLTLAGLLIDAKRTSEAERQLQQALALDPAQSDTSMLLARLQADRGGNVEAIKTLQRGLPNAENQADYQALLATLLDRSGQHQAAIEHYLTALRYAPQSGTWWIGLGIALQADGQADKARAAFLRARATNSLNADLSAYVDQQLK
jgi:MSHA biogenesis protein MshN